MKEKALAWLTLALTISLIYLAWDTGADIKAIRKVAERLR